MYWSRYVWTGVKTAYMGIDGETPIGEQIFKQFFLILWKSAVVYWSKDQKRQLQAIKDVKTNSLFNVLQLHNGCKTSILGLGHLSTLWSDTTKAPVSAVSQKFPPITSFSVFHSQTYSSFWKSSGHSQHIHPRIYSKFHWPAAVLYSSICLSWWMTM